jgi:hypothetical protein
VTGVQTCAFPILSNLKKINTRVRRCQFYALKGLKSGLNGAKAGRRCVQNAGDARTARTPFLIFSFSRWPKVEQSDSRKGESSPKGRAVRMSGAIQIVGHPHRRGNRRAKLWADLSGAPAFPPHVQYSPR